jgi:integrase
MAHIQRRCRGCGRGVPPKAQACPSCGRREIGWRARHRQPGGTERARTFERKADAERWLASQETAKARGEWIDPRLGLRPFDQWAWSWLRQATHLRPSSRARTESALRVHLLPRFGARAVASITTLDVRQLVADLDRAGQSPASVRKVYNTLSAVLRAAVEAGLLGRSPCVGIKLPTPRKVEQRYLTPEEVHRLAAAVPARYRALILVGAYGGLRFGELAGLRVDRVDFLRRRLTVADTIVEVQGHLHHGPPKSGRTRAVTLPAVVIDELAHHVAAFPPVDGLIFTTPTGRPIRRQQFRSRVWKPATTTAGLAGLRPHDLRHTAAALAIATGAHPKAIQDRLGHASITTTLDLYGHLLPDVDDQLADRLNAMAHAPGGAQQSRPDRLLTARARARSPNDGNR